MCRRTFREKIESMVRVRTDNFRTREQWFSYCVELERKLYQQNSSIANERIASGLAIRSMNKRTI